ncbi:MAG: FAD-dependent oxidoreductase [Peptococcaceae bacterium]|jgi:2,4-dienoyl-CoA reductase-like NADH-dependent reductase (Old Yellow Enzyme family)/thioredoxin reductase|nr:FAD-dependent oxidoreductase [Peptococcaceae bacterium]MDH7524831.1 FAD-dependent oxidoreductase [Peptococcaceae bacterium]
MSMLFSPITIGNMKLKNRIVMAPMATHFANKEGRVTKKIIDYYAERARGGTGLIITESCYVIPQGRGGNQRLGIHEDGLIDGLSQLTDAVHANGAMIAAELHHGGPQVPRMVIGEMPAAASNVYYQAGVIPPPRALSKEEVKQVVAAYAAAAGRAVKAGFDALLIHGGHGYLINSFLSPVTNRRTDCYGGDLSNRMRFLLEIIGAIRDRVGDSLPVMVRLNAEDFVEGGIRLPESLEMARMLQDAHVDCIHVTAGTHLSMEMMVQPMAIPRGVLVPFAAAIKKEVAVPVAVVGRINNPELAAKILEEGKADLITLGRALIADPYFPQKAAQGKADEIRPCIACNQGCNYQLHQGRNITCFGNPSVGKEEEWRISSAPHPKNVLVVGGGPAGMQAALTAAARGHKVVLCERNQQLGGQLYLASKPPCKDEIANLLSYMSAQLARLNVDIRLNQEIGLEDIKKMQPDAVVVATGSIPFIPPIEGVNLPHVVTAQAVLRKPEIVAGKTAVIGGGGTGLETAEFLAEKGLSVIVIEMMEDIAGDMEPTRRKLILNRLSEKGIRILIKAKVKRINPGCVVIEWLGNEQSIDADSVVLATGALPVKKLGEELRELNLEVHFVGDCLNPRTGLDAISDGFQAGLSI